MALIVNVFIGRWKMKRLKIIIAIALSCLCLSGCDFLQLLTPMNNAPPSYIKKIGSFNEGSDALVVYIVLADKTGAMTTAAGTLDVRIFETMTSYSSSKGFTSEFVPLYKASYTVEISSFQRTKVGRGSFEHQVILVSLGRITYSRFLSMPKEIMGKIFIEFKTKDGKVIKGNDTLVF